MQIVRVGRKFEIVEGLKTIQTFKSFKKARDFLASKGIKDAKGDLSRGHIGIDGYYDEEYSQVLRAENERAMSNSPLRKEVQK